MKYRRGTAKGTFVPKAYVESAKAKQEAASQIHDRMLTMVARGAGDTDWSALARLSASDAGLHS
jgi:hypothetical protein